MIAFKITLSNILHTYHTIITYNTLFTHSNYVSHLFGTSGSQIKELV